MILFIFDRFAITNKLFRDAIPFVGWPRSRCLFLCNYNSRPNKQTDGISRPWSIWPSHVRTILCLNIVMISRPRFLVTKRLIHSRELIIFSKCCFLFKQDLIAIGKQTESFTYFIHQARTNVDTNSAKLERKSSFNLQNILVYFN